MRTGGSITSSSTAKILSSPHTVNLLIFVAFNFRISLMECHLATINSHLYLISFHGSTQFSQQFIFEKNFSLANIAKINRPWNWVGLQYSRALVNLEPNMMNLKWATPWENLFMQYADNKGSDQPAHPRSLISAFVVRCLDSIIPLLAIAKISRL